MDRLIASKQVSEKTGSYYITNPSLLIIARIVVILKMLTLGKKSEFD